MSSDLYIFFWNRDDGVGGGGRGGVGVGRVVVVVMVGEEASSDNILHSDVKKLAIMRERISKLSWFNTNEEQQPFKQWVVCSWSPLIQHISTWN